MDLRSRVNESLKDAMKAHDTERRSTLRLINAAIKDRDIALRGNGDDSGVDDTEVLGILGKMVKQRQESARAYEEGGRVELAEQERSEIQVIEGFLPKQLSDDQVADAIREAISAVDAKGIRDMGRVMGVLKGKFTGQMDFGSVGARIKKILV